MLRQRINDRWMQRGVTMWDPARTYVDADVVLAAEVSLLPGTVLKGRCVVERGAQIGPNAVLVDSSVGEGAVVGVVEATARAVGADARVGSFVVLAPGAVRGPGGDVIAPFTHLTRSRRRPPCTLAPWSLSPSADSSSSRAAATPSWPRTSPTSSA